MDTLKTLIIHRKLRHISQPKMAAMLGITTTTLHRYEANKRAISLELVELYAEKLGFELKLIAVSEMSKELSKY